MLSPAFTDPTALLGWSSLPRWDSGNSAEAGQSPRPPDTRNGVKPRPSAGAAPAARGRERGRPVPAAPAEDLRDFPHGILTPRARREPT